MTFFKAGEVKGREGGEVMQRLNFSSISVEL